MWFQKKRIELHVKLQLAACISSSERDRFSCRDIFRTGHKCLEEYWNNSWKWKFTLKVRFWHFWFLVKVSQWKNGSIKRPHNALNLNFPSQKLRVKANISQENQVLCQILIQFSIVLLYNTVHLNQNILKCPNTWHKTQFFFR